MLSTNLGREVETPKRGYGFFEKTRFSMLKQQSPQGKKGLSKLRVDMGSLSHLQKQLCDGL